MEILLHVGDLGWHRCVWTDNALSTKKLYPGHQFSSKGKTWSARLRTSEKSMALAVQRAQTLHEKAPEWMRKKIDVAKVEQVSERAAVIVALEAELMQRMPLDLHTVQEVWSKAWAQGSEHVDVEVQALLLEKDEKLDLTRDVGIFRKVIDDHLQSQPVRSGATGNMETMEMREKLEF